MAHRSLDRTDSSDLTPYAPHQANDCFTTHTSNALENRKRRVSSDAASREQSSSPTPEQRKPACIHDGTTQAIALLLSSHKQGKEPEQ